MAFKLTKDTKVWDRLKKDLNSNSGLELKVGFFENSVYGPENDNLQVAQVAQWNEEGSATNPTRPFIRVGFMSPIKAGSYEKYFKLAITRILEGKSSFATEYKILGPVAVKDMKQSIADWDTPPNSPITIADKGFNNPLIDSGLMYESVDFKVEKKGSK